MGKITIPSYFFLFVISSHASCWHDAPEFQRIRKTQYCFASKNNYRVLVNSNGFYSFHYPADYTNEPSSRLNILPYNENFIFYPNGESITFLSTDTSYVIWGSYYIDRDTIKAQYYPAPINVAGFRTEIWFRMVGNNKLTIIGRTWSKLLGESDLEKYRRNNPGYETHTSQFINRNEIPDPNQSWLKKRKWFWCDNEDYLRWKDAQLK